MPREFDGLLERVKRVVYVKSPSVEGVKRVIVERLAYAGSGV
jgi:hypothetical protein